MDRAVRSKILARKIGKILWVVARFLILFGLGYTLISPFISIISGAFRAQQDLWDPSVVWITRHYTLDNFKEVIRIMDYWKALLNTALIAVGSAFFQMFSCALAGYGFARFGFKGKGFWFGIVILTILVPPQVLMMPTYNIYRSIGLLDSVGSFWITSIFGMGLRSGLFIFIYRQIFRSLPTDLEDAASIDGCGQIGIFFRIMLPNAATSMATVFLFSFIWHSTDYFTTTVMLPTKQTLTTALSILNSQLSGLIAGTTQSTVSPLLMQAQMQADCLLTVIPLLAVFIVCQRYFREGIARTGLVG